MEGDGFAISPGFWRSDARGTVARLAVMFRQSGDCAS